MGPTATPAAAPTACPQCGAKVLRPELSLCAYCASPLGLGKAEAPKTAAAERLARMRAHPDFERVLAWSPEDPREARARGLRGRGIVAGVAAILLLSWGVAPRLTGGGPLLRLPILAGGVLAGLGVFALARSSRLAAARPTGPLLRRPALVTERRSETTDRGADCITQYFFTLEFEDGSVGEFAFPGRGSSHDLLVPGNTGLAFTRGPHLLDFIKVRV